MSTLRRSSLRSLPARCRCWLAIALPGQAQYKVVGPDGKVTYTDRAPTPATARSARSTCAQRAGRRRAPTAARAAPGRQRAIRSRCTPATGTCEPCETGRDAAAPARHPVRGEAGRSASRTARPSSACPAARDAPTLTIGGQIVARHVGRRSGTRTSTPPAIRASRSCRRLPVQGRRRSRTPLAASRPMQPRRCSAAPAAAPSGGIRFCRPQTPPPPAPAGAGRGIRF